MSRLNGLLPPVNGTPGGGPPVLLDHTGRPIRTVDEMAVPHVYTYSALLRSGARTYFHQWDEAMKQSRQNALALRTDPHLMGCLKERKRAVCNLKWQLEPDDPRDPFQQAVAEELTRIVTKIPRFLRLKTYLKEDIWYGRYGATMKWDWKQQEPSGMNGAAGAVGFDDPAVMNPLRRGYRYLTLVKHRPVNGDKIGFHEDGTPYLLINWAMRDQFPKSELVTNSTGGLGLLLRGSWRDKCLISITDPDDADFYEPEMAARVYGVGARSYLAMSAFCRLEFYSWAVEALERWGLGIVYIEYPAGNAAAKLEAEKAGQEFSRRSVFLVPVAPGGGGRGADGGSIRVVETPTAGLEAVLRLREYHEGLENRFINGQISSFSNDAEGMGTHDQTFQMQTKSDVTQSDAQDLDETLTGSDEEFGLIHFIKAHTFPQAKSFDVRYVSQVQKVDPEKLLGAANLAFAMGASFKESEILAATGFSQPIEGEATLSQMGLMMQQSALAPPPGAAPGGPEGEAADVPSGGEPPALGDEDIDGMLDQGVTPQQYGAVAEALGYAGGKGPQPGQVTSLGGAPHEPAQEPNLTTYLQNRFAHAYDQPPAMGHATGFLLANGQAVQLGHPGEMRWDEHAGALPSNRSMQRWGWPADVVRHHAEGTTEPAVRELLRRSGAARIHSSPDLVVVQHQTPLSGRQRSALTAHLLTAQPARVRIEHPNGQATDFATHHDAVEHLQSAHYQRDHLERLALHYEGRGDTRRAAFVRGLLAYRAPQPAPPPGGFGRQARNTGFEPPLPHPVPPALTPSGATEATGVSGGMKPVPVPKTPLLKGIGPPGTRTYEPSHVHGNYSNTSTYALRALSGREEGVFGKPGSWFGTPLPGLDEKTRGLAADIFHGKSWDHWPALANHLQETGHPLADVFARSALHDEVAGALARNGHGILNQFPQHGAWDVRGAKGEAVPAREGVHHSLLHESLANEALRFQDQHATLPEAVHAAVNEYFPEGASSGHAVQHYKDLAPHIDPHGGLDDWLRSKMGDPEEYARRGEPLPYAAPAAAPDPRAVAAAVLAANSPNRMTGLTPNIPELFDRVAPQHPGLTEPYFHHLLRHMQAQDLGTLQQWGGSGPDQMEKVTGFPRARFPLHPRGGYAAWFAHQPDAAGRVGGMAPPPPLPAAGPQAYGADGEPLPYADPTPFNPAQHPRRASLDPSQPSAFVSTTGQSPMPAPIPGRPPPLATPTSGAGQQPALPGPGQVAQHLGGGADRAALLMQAGAVPWHQMHADDAAAMRRALAGGSGSQLLRLMEAREGQRQAEPMNPAHGAAREIMRGALRARPQGPEVEPTPENWGHAHSVQFAGLRPAEQAQLGEMLRAMPRVAGRQNAHYLPRGLDLSRVAGFPVQTRALAETEEAPLPPQATPPGGHPLPPPNDRNILFKDANFGRMGRGQAGLRDSYWVTMPDGRRYFAKRPPAPEHDFELAANQIGRTLGTPNIFEQGSYDPGRAGGGKYLVAPKVPGVDLARADRDEPGLQSVRETMGPRKLTQQLLHRWLVNSGDAHWGNYLAHEGQVYPIDFGTTFHPHPENEDLQARPDALLESGLVKPDDPLERKDLENILKKEPEIRRIVEQHVLPHFHPNAGESFHPDAVRGVLDRKFNHLRRLLALPEGQQATAADLHKDPLHWPRTGLDRLPDWRNLPDNVGTQRNPP